VWVQPHGVTVDSNGNIYVTNGRHGSISVISGTTDIVNTTIPLLNIIGIAAPKPAPYGIAFNPK
jgi:DNA-binding beta-propeller fold protein YncE